MEQYINKVVIETEPELDTPEVKEVDLDKEFDKCCGNYIFDDEYDVYIAKRFFKLGFNAHNSTKIATTNNTV